MKIVINNCHGGFSLSRVAIARYVELTGFEQESVYDRDIARDDSLLIQIIDEMGALANGDFAQLKIVEIPDDVNWYIEEYDGLEHVAEKHRTWR